MGLSVQRAWPSGGSVQVRATILASASPSSLTLPGRLLGFLRSAAPTPDSAGARLTLSTVRSLTW